MNDINKNYSEDAPSGGSIIRYQYIWSDEALAGELRAEKARPVAIVLPRTSKGRTIVLPVTHSEPFDKDVAIEIPEDERRQSGLDDEISWIILSECNSFSWPSDDVDIIPDRMTYLYGEFSYEFFQEVLARFKAVIGARRSAMVSR